MKKDFIWDSNLWDSEMFLNSIARNLHTAGLSMDSKPNRYSSHISYRDVVSKQSTYR